MHLCEDAGVVHEVACPWLSAFAEFLQQALQHLRIARLAGKVGVQQVRQFSHVLNCLAGALQRKRNLISRVSLPPSPWRKDCLGEMGCYLTNERCHGVRR